MGRDLFIHGILFFKVSGMFLFSVFIFFNLVVFGVYGWDKRKAKRGKWRIPETTLLLLALMGGAFGAYWGMKVFHHKTQHKKFTLLVPLFMLMWLIAGGYLIYYRVICQA